MGKLRAGIIGVGGMGVCHLKGYLEHPDVDVAAVADIREERQAMLAKDFPAFHGSFYTDWREMLRKEKFDIVSVVVPNRLHREMTVAALEAGANVLCEKPMAMSTAEAQEMLETAKRCGRKLGIDFSYRFNPQSRAMKALVDTGALGDIYYARTVWLRRRGIPGLAAANFNTGSCATDRSWFYHKTESGGGPLIDLGVHRLDLALWLMGYPEPAYVMGSTYCKLAPELAKRHHADYTVEDFACAMIKFRNGATLELDASWASNIKENEQMSTRLIGDKGGLYHFNLNETYTYDVEFYHEADGRQYDTKLHIPCPEAPSAYQLFVEAVRDDTPFLVQPEEGVTVMRLLDAIYESSRTGQPVVF